MRIIDGSWACGLIMGAPDWIICYSYSYRILNALAYTCEGCGLCDFVVRKGALFLQAPPPSRTYDPCFQTILYLLEYSGSTPHWQWDLCTQYIYIYIYMYIYVYTVYYVYYGYNMYIICI